MERSAVVYSINGRLLVGASRRTPTGLRLEVDPQVIEAKAGVTEVAALLSNALEASTPIAVPPSSWAGVFDPFLKAAGVRSLKAFMASAQCANIDEHDGTLVVTPNRNLGAKEGFEPDPSQAATVADVRHAAQVVLAQLRG